jgi:hypothetical protein
MARPLRLQIPGGIYHVRARGNSRTSVPRRPRSASVPRAVRARRRPLRVDLTRELPDGQPLRALAADAAAEPVERNATAERVHAQASTSVTAVVGHVLGTLRRNPGRGRRLRPRSRPIHRSQPGPAPASSIIFGSPGSGLAITHECKTWRQRFNVSLPRVLGCRHCHRCRLSQPVPISPRTTFPDAL